MSNAWTFDDMISAILPGEPDIQAWILARDGKSMSTLIDTGAWIIKHCRRLDVGERDLLASLADEMRATVTYGKDSDGVFRRLDDWGLVCRAISKAYALTSAAVEGDQDARCVLAQRMRPYQPVGHLLP